MSGREQNPRSIRILAAIGLALCLVCLIGTWAFMRFNEFYFPHMSQPLGYFELALWCVLCVYLGAVVLRGTLTPWRL